MGLIMGMTKKSIVQTDPEIMSGEPCFAGTRVPVRTLLDYIEGGDSLDEFLEDFPTVSRRQAIAFLGRVRRCDAGENSASRLMRILLDECLPARLRRDLPGHEVLTVPRAGWAGVKNGKLLRLIAESGQIRCLPHDGQKTAAPAKNQRPAFCRCGVAGKIESF